MTTPQEVSSLPSETPALDFADIQGIILCDYTLPLVRHFLLRIDSAGGGRRFLAVLSEANLAPLRITSTADWVQNQRRDYCLNIGLTYTGLAALNLPTTTLASFAPAEAFARGAAARAALIGDINDSAPSQWKKPLATTDVHILLSLYTGLQQVEDQARTLRAMFHQYQLTELYCAEGALLSDPRPHGGDLPGVLIHFGYRDNISQPKIAGAPAPQYATARTVTVQPGAFLLGYPSQWQGFRYPVPRPPELGKNGSFAAFRILQQHVREFEEYLTKAAAATGMERETVAAKLCGRWRNGTPLVQSPTAPPSPSAQPNDFDYADDPYGYKCPFDSHIRRTNPRGDIIAGSDGAQHPIIRRGMPYGPRYDSAAGKDDGAERGLLGLFICVSLEDQFEFLMTDWMNRGGVRPELPSRARDITVTSSVFGGTSFRVPTPDGVIVLPKFSHFVTTRGAAYCFLPSLTALRYLGNL
jgi:deferrochelatase/peroxidase EfeB